MPEAEIFETIYQDYLDQIAKLNLKAMAKRLGIKVADGVAEIPLFGKLHRVSGKGIKGPGGKRPGHAVCVILAKYLILCPEYVPLEAEWVTYKDFKDGAPFVGGFLNTAERPVARLYSGRLADLKKACETLGGAPPPKEFSSDLALIFQALPRVPLLMLYNDADDEFPAQCTLLFERRAQHYLDMECLAMIGMALAERLKRLVKAP